MALAEDKERIFVTVSKDMCERIDFYRQKMGLSRSAFCSYLIGQGVMTMDRTMGLWDEVGKAIVTKSVETFEDAAEQSKQKEGQTSDHEEQLRLDA